jgi:hypothetical protein
VPVDAVSVCCRRGTPLISGAETLVGAATFVPPPPPPPPPPEAAVTTCVGRESADAPPALFEAVTRTRSVDPTSPVRTVYVAAVSDPMSAQLAPELEHLRHWYVIDVGPFDQEPGDASSV